MRLGRLLFALGVVALIGYPASPAAAAVDVEAQVGRRSLTLGETTSLEVVVRGAVTGVRPPEFDVPPGLEVLGSGRSQSVSTVNGRVSTATVFRFELAPNRAGNFSVGPIRVWVGGQLYESPAMSLSVSAARTRLGRGGQGPASLDVDLSPADPYVGQPVIMRVRLIQRASLAEDPRYTPPATTGFWAERPSQPESYYADEALSRVLVTETRTRLYPLATGEATIGQGVVTLALAVTGSRADPLTWLGGRPPRREVTVLSPPMRVGVRRLPAGAPADFSGAVGTFQSSWSADRPRTSLDVPVTVRLEVRGYGNLPLLHTPSLRSRAFEVFASTVEDSLALPGSTSSGRRRFQWTVLARRQGVLELEAPAFVWFDPSTGRYRRLEAPAVAIEVGPPLTPGRAESPDAFPTVLGAHPLDPFRRGSEPWAFALVGLALGAAVRLWRGAPRGSQDAAERARQREWLHAVGRGTGQDFWTAADRACEWLEMRGRPLHHLRRQIASARYGGARTDMEALRAKLVEYLHASLPSAQPRWISRVGAVALVLAAIVLGVTLGPRGGMGRGVTRALMADRAARAGDIERARREWFGLWREGAHHAGLAARLAWADVRAGAVGPASVWVLRGDREEPRDPALAWVAGQVREAGGLSGFTSARWPVRRIEWSALALALGLATAAPWHRRWLTVSSLGLLVACATLYPVQGWLAARSSRAVVSSGVRFEGTNLELEPGHVVTVLERSGRRARATAGRGVSGWLPADAVETPERLR